MSPVDHLIVSVLGRRRAEARERRPAPEPVRAGSGRPSPADPAPGRRPTASGDT
ncbi:hypothetical protein PV458_01105 [Streptomyces sp. MN03-5084-2B]|nr:hypothetical protein [Streptomyces sp. MN03-5084-2B]